LFYKLRVLLILVTIASMSHSFLLHL